MPDKRTVLGYQTHYMMDGGRARVILHALTMPGDVMENQPFLDQLRRVLFRWKLHPDRVIADTKYSTIENIKALDAMGITAYMPLRDWEYKTEYFGASHFTYDTDKDIYHLNIDMSTDQAPCDSTKPLVGRQGYTGHMLANVPVSASLFNYLDDMYTRFTNQGGCARDGKVHE